MKATRRAADASGLAPATLSEADGVRYLHLGTPWVQGAMRIARPQAIELEYVQRMMVWLLLRPAEAPGRGHAVQLGLGAGAITRFTRRTLRMRTTAVELNPTVVDACRLWFRLPADDARMSVQLRDAGRWVEDPSNAGTADVLCVDLYDHDAAAPVLDDQAFYDGCHRVLTEGGAMTVNLFGVNASFARSAGRIAAAFGEEQVRSLQPTREGNTVVAALKGAPWPDRETLALRAESVQGRYGLPAKKWLRMIRRWPPEPRPTAKDPLP